MDVPDIQNKRDALIYLKDLMDDDYDWTGDFNGVIYFKHDLVQVFDPHSNYKIKLLEEESKWNYIESEIINKFEARCLYNLENY